METDLKSYRSEFVPVSCNQGLRGSEGHFIMQQISDIAKMGEDCQLKINAIPLYGIYARQ